MKVTQAMKHAGGIALFNAIGATYDGEEDDLAETIFLIMLRASQSEVDPESVSEERRFGQNTQ